MVANATAVVRVCDQLVAELCGETVKDVFHVLASKGQQTLEGVIRLSELPKPAVRSALLVLLQHSFVTSQLVQPEASLKGTPPPFFLYTADTAAALQVLRWPWLLHHIAKEYRDSAEDKDTDVLAVNIVQALLEHGRLRTDQILSLVAGLRASNAQLPEGAIMTCLVNLVHSRYVQRARGCNAERPQKPLPATVKVRGAGSKSGSLEKAKMEAQAARSLAETTYQDERFSLPPGFLTGSNGSPGVKLPVSATKRRKIEAESAACKATSQTILWMVNMEECNRMLRQALCIEHMESAHAAEAGALAAALLKAGQKLGSADPVDESATGADAANMLAKMRSTDPSLPALKQEAAVKLLRKLAEDDSCCIESRGMAGLQDKLFVLNYKKGLATLRQRHIETIVRERFTIVGMRIFRMLLSKKQLEQKQIADFAMVPVREAREVLYKMLQGGFLALQDLPRSADHAANRTIFTWHIDMDAVRRRVATEVLHSIGNLRARMEHEISRRAELMMMMDLGVELSDQEREEGQKLGRIVALMQIRTLALDSHLLLFEAA